MGRERKRTGRAAAIERALMLTIEAQDIIDAHKGPPEAGVHLELCRQKLQQELARPAL